MESHYLHWNPRIHTGIREFVLEYRDPYGNLRMYTGNLEFLPKSTEILRFELQSQESHRNLTVHAKITKSTQESHELHWKSKLYSELIEFTLESQNSNWNFNIHTKIPRSTLSSYDPQHSTRIQSEILEIQQSKDSHWNKGTQTETPQSKLELWNPLSQDLHWIHDDSHPNSIFTEILRSILQSKDPHCNQRAYTHWSTMIFTGVPWSTL